MSVIYRITRVSSGLKNGTSAIKGFSTIQFRGRFTLEGADASSTVGVPRLIFKINSATIDRAVTLHRVSPKEFYFDYEYSLSANDPIGQWNPSFRVSWKKTSASPPSTYSFVLPSIRVEKPKWEFTKTVNQPPPPILQDGKALIDALYVYKWENGAWGGYDTFTSPLEVVDVQENQWTFKYTVSDAYVDAPETETPNTKIALVYKNHDVDEREYRTAFFSTTRSQNYSNGIYNIMCVSGATNSPNYTSRVWWSAVNDPLYFPDTNYSEVGSNDTSIQGLTKVGDYLAVVKQSKTTDTAIYLLYPTSFEEDTTYAVKQGVQGIGALGKYSFNILGNETLFLSPRGVMAVIPSDDEEHKVQNRSYFIDGKLLKEDGLADAYSFVYDGKYWLSIGNGHCYVLDGNQRNSWGNDRTNLVYECYYLDNVPATCFVKFRDQLVFTDGNNLCVFNNGFVDAYNTDGDENIPVSAEWSTVFDDDGVLHYYKTMQKKGNLVSVFPKENELPYILVEIDEETFNANKTMYYTFNGDKYVKCKESDSYGADIDYYIANPSNTKVFIKKDDDPEVEINRTFGVAANIPGELFLNKKFKKYKRLQFIIKNDADEPFGIDSIVKNYTIGNYAKR